ncbi:unnamed protein product [Heterobilharzia americana]|nr:unnamed protein product [Heterobilharzia americana]
MPKDLHQIRPNSDKNHHIPLNNKDTGEVNFPVYRQSSHLIKDTVKNITTPTSATGKYNTLQLSSKDNSIPKTNLSSQRQQQVPHQPIRTTTNTCSSSESHITSICSVSRENQNRTFPKYEYNIQSNKFINESFQYRRTPENSVDNNNLNYEITNCTSKTDYHLRNSTTKEPKSVHWSEDLDTTDASRKQVVSGVHNTNNNIRIVPSYPITAATAITTTTTTTTTTGSIVSSANSHINIYGTSYPVNQAPSINTRRQNITEDESVVPNTSYLPSHTKPVNEILRKLSSSSSVSPNASNQIPRSQSLYTYLFKQNELNNKPVTTSINLLSSTIRPSRPHDGQPKLPPKQTPVNTTINSSDTKDNNKNTVDYSVARRSTCSSVYGLENMISSNSSTTSHIPMYTKHFSPTPIRGSPWQTEADRFIDRNQSSGPNLSLKIYLPDRTSRFVSVNNTTTVLQTLQSLTGSSQKLLNMRHALVEKIPVLQLERCLEDNEYLLNYLSTWKTENENLIFFEERQDMYGLFESPKIWLGEHFTAFSITSNKNIFNRNEKFSLPSHTDQLYLRIGPTKWKRRYFHLNKNGLYFSKQKSPDKSSIKRLNIFQPNLYLYITMPNQVNTESPTPFGLVVRPHSTQQADSRVIVEMCALNEESWKIWYSLLRTALFGKRLSINYMVRTDIVKVYRENCSHGDYQLRNSSCFNSISDRPISSTTSDLENEQILGDIHSSFDPSSKTSSIDIGYPLKSVSYSVNDLSKPLQLNLPMNEGNHRPNEASSLTSLTLYPIQTSIDQSINRQSRLDKRNIKLVKKRIFGNGPAARRCTRSISQISSPFNISLPNWIRASYEDKVNERFNETVL